MKNTVSESGSHLPERGRESGGRVSHLLRSFRELAGRIISDHKTEKNEVWETESASGVRQELGRRNVNTHVDDQGRYHFIRPKLVTVPDLPPGYGIKGGGARALLRDTLGMPYNPRPRDIDVVRLVAEEPHPGEDAMLASRHMPGDYATGHGVETYLSQETYFSTRDLTVNEVLAMEDEVIATEAAVRDTLEGRLQLTEYEREGWEAAGEKLRLKMLRMLASSMGHIVHEDDWQGEVEISSFWIAVNLERAMQQGRWVAEEFIELLYQDGLIPDWIMQPEQLAEYLRQDLPFFTFRSIREWDQFKAQQEEWEDRLFDEQDRLSGNGRKGKRK